LFGKLWIYFFTVQWVPQAKLEAYTSTYEQSSRNNAMWWNKWFLIQFNWIWSSSSLAATTNKWVVTRAINAKVRETNYYGIINKILEFSFAGNKELTIVFFDCEWFDNNNWTRQNQFGMVQVKHNEWLWGYDTFILAHHVKQVYYLPYPCEKLSACWVVYKVNPHEQLYTSGDARYHDTLALNDDIDEVYQEEELTTSFLIEPGVRLDDLVWDADEIQITLKQKQKPIKKKVWLPTLRTRVPNRDAGEFWN
jgi:hypothetical protein